MHARWPRYRIGVILGVLVSLALVTPVLALD